MSKSAFPEKAGAETPTALLGSKSMRQYQIQDYETDGATCPECGEVFSGRKGLSKHHSHAHGDTFPTLAACDECGEMFESDPVYVGSGSQYCSDGCRDAGDGRRESLTGEEHPQYRREQNECDWCGESFETIPSKSRRFCSQECHISWMGDQPAEETPGWKGGPKKKECEGCGTTFGMKPSQELRFCSRDCYAESLRGVTGPEHPLWKGGVDWYRAVRSAHGPTGWHTQRKEHLGDECKVCGTSDATLSLHHIVPVLAGGSNAPWNYMTLCRTCHPTVESYTRDLPGMKPVLTE